MINIKSLVTCFLVISSTLFGHIDKSENIIFGVKPRETFKENPKENIGLGKKALIIGVGGQDGSYLAELLLNKGYEVHGVKRRASLFNTARIEHLYGNDRFFLHYGDVTDSSNMISVIGQIQPDEIYNLAAQSHVRVSFELPEYTGQVDALGTLRILEAIRILGL